MSDDELTLTNYLRDLYQSRAQINTEIDIVKKQVDAMKDERERDGR